jgi:biopolymer transport protein ExbB/TolQ
MGLFSGITSSLINPVSLAQLAMGPAGWASLAMRTIGAAIAKEVIQQLGQQLGLPQGVINMAQNAFSAATGTTGGPASIAEAVAGLAQQFGLSPSQQGELTRAAQNDSRDMFEKLAEAFQSGKEKAEAKKSSKDGRSWLQAIADSMSTVLDKKVEDMDKMAQALDKQGTNRSTKSSTDLQVAGQEFSYLMNSTSTVIKTIGEGLSGMARKQ